MTRTRWLLARGYAIRGGVDNVEADAGAGGATFATDDIGGVHYPRTKLVLGADGAADLDLDSGQQVMAASLPVAIASNQSAIPVTDNSGALTVDNAGTFAVQVDGNALTALQLIDDTVYVDDADWADGSSKHVLVGGLYESSQQTVTDGDVAPLAIDANGNARVRIMASAAIPVTQSGTWDEVGINDSGNVITVDGSGSAGTAATGVVTVQGIASMTPVQVSQATASNLNAQVVGAVAHDGNTSVNPVQIGYRAESSPKGITLVADADVTHAYSDLDGVPLVKLNTTGTDLLSERVSNTDGASTAFTNFSNVASTFNYVTAITAFRTDSGTSLAYVDFRDGTGGAILYSVPLPPTGGSTVTAGGMPLFKTSANTALAYDVSAALNAVIIAITGFQSKA